MKIEPCPICGGTNVRIINNSGDSIGAECLNEEDLLEMKAEVRCVECGHAGGQSWGKWLKSSNIHCLKERIDEWNRLSRIVRAAEEWAKARRTGTMIEISESGNELLVAVEGGRADG